MGLRTLFETVSGDHEELARNDKARVAKTATTTMREAGNLIKQGARASIASGGFSSRWQNALRVNVYPKSGTSDSPAAFVYHKIKYAGQFENPLPVVGKPLLWLPIMQNLPGGRRWTPAMFVRTMGPLRAGRHGSRPILFGQVTVGGGGKIAKYPKTLKQIRRWNQSGTQWVPVFVGVSSVTDPRRFDITAVVQGVSGQLDAMYASNWDASDG